MVLRAGRRQSVVVCSGGGAGGRQAGGAAVALETELGDLAGTQPFAVHEFSDTAAEQPSGVPAAVVGGGPVGMPGPALRAFSTLAYAAPLVAVRVLLALTDSRRRLPSPPLTWFSTSYEMSGATSPQR